jgi:hypothetical protein
MIELNPQPSTLNPNSQGADVVIGYNYVVVGYNYVVVGAELQFS